MTLRVCDGERLGEPCRTLFAVGVLNCPHCKSSDHHEFGSRPEDEEHPQMAKLRVHGGPSNGPDESLTAGGSGTGDDEGPAAPAAEPLGSLADTARPAVNAPKREWVAYAAAAFNADPDALDEGYSKRDLIKLVGELESGASGTDAEGAVELHEGAVVPVGVGQETETVLAAGEEVLTSDDTDE